MEGDSQKHPTVDVSQQSVGDPAFNNVPELPRESLIVTAVKFLQNPKVVSSPLAQKRAFLLNKGLTDKEIDIAIQRSGTPSNVTADGGNNAVITHSSPVYANVAPPPPVIVTPALSGWTKFREYLSSAVLIGGTVYGLYYLYKKYLAPYLFGKRKNKLDVLEESLTELKKTSETMLQCLREVQLQQQQQTALAPWTSRFTPEESSRTIDKQYVEDIKGEIKSLKALLLTPRQFPQVPITKPLLPEWQLNQATNATLQPSVSSSSTLPSRSSATDMTSGSLDSVVSPVVNAEIADETKGLTFKSSNAHEDEYNIITETGDKTSNPVSNGHDADDN